VQFKEEKELAGDKETEKELSWSQALRINSELLPEGVSRNQLQQLSPGALAYLGDAVYELYIRMSYLLPPQRLDNYHGLVVAKVRGETQAKILKAILPCLTANELDIVRRGRNACSGRPKRLKPEIYQQATSLETLIGYLYLTDRERLSELLTNVIFNLE
jgi:ribonuclease-3 family protein